MNCEPRHWRLEEPRLPDDLKVFGDADAFKIFGLAEPDSGRARTWGEIRTQLASWGSFGKYWDNSVGETLHMLCRERRIDPGLPLLRVEAGPSQAEANSYRPIILSYSRGRNGMWSVKIAFARLPGDLERMPSDDLGHITRLLWFTRMFTYGIVEHFGRELSTLEAKAATPAQDPDDEYTAYFAKLSRAIELVVAEGYNTGYDPQAVAESLGPSLVTEYQEARQQWALCQGQLRTIAANPDVVECRRVLREMAAIAERVYRLAGERFMQLTNSLNVRYQ